MEVTEELKEISQRLRQVRNFYKLSQVEMAERLHLSQPNYNHYENGRHDIKNGFVTLLKTEFFINPDWLLYGEGEMIETSIANPDNGDVGIILDLINKLEPEFLNLVAEYAETVYKVQSKYKHKNAVNKGAN